MFPVTRKSPHIRLAEFSGVPAYNPLHRKDAGIKRVNRVEGGNFGDHKFCRDGIWELRIDQGAGYRVYYALASNVVVLLLCGGDKGSQDADINRAIGYWNDWQRRPAQ